MYELKNISVIIPTYNRAKDLEATLESLSGYLKKIHEVIIVDQSKNQETRSLINKLKNKKIKYVFSEIPAITIARNVGVKNSNKKNKIICFLDDDVTVVKGYFEEIVGIFNKYGAVGVSSYNTIPEELKQKNLERVFSKIFFIGCHENKEQAKILSAYGNTYPLKLTKIINSQWLPGVNMCYLKEIFEEQRFDENLLGYTIAEDIDFSYRLWKKYPNKLFITPFARVEHRISLIEREPTERMAFINQIDHFYFNFKNMNENLLQRIIFIWSLIGISILRPLKFIITRGGNDYLKMKFYYKSLFYCLRNLDKIKAGKLREF